MKNLSNYIGMLLFLIPATLLFYGCGDASQPLDTDLIRNPKTAEGTAASQAPAIEFTRHEVDFGRLIQGEIATFIFRFKNTGNADLILSKVSADCGCTASKYTTKPVKPGEEGTIEVVFDSKGLRGVQNKVVTVLSNTSPSITSLRVKAQVVLP
jgi:hypothetical protein